MDDERIKTAILRDGFFVVEDLEVASRVDAFARNKYPFQTQEGVAFLRATLNDNRVVDTVEALFERSGLGMFRAFGPHPDTARAALNRTTDELLVLTVFHCQHGSSFILYENSFLYDLDAKPGNPDIGLLELPIESMAIPGIRKKKVDLPEGGLMILDGRFFSTTVTGTVLQVGFAVLKELEEWGKMPLPSWLKATVRDMDRENIKLNVKYVEARRLN